MADAHETEDKETTDGHEASNGSGRKTVVRAAALAAASGATAFAAKKAFSDRGSTSVAKRKSDDTRGGQEGESLVSSMVTSAWDSARDSLVPMIEDAASQAGEFLAQNGPEIVRETVIPQFIRGFERGQKSHDDE